MSGKCNHLFKRFENRRVYSKLSFISILKVIASDGVNTGATFVELNVLNVNDNVPRFFNSSYTLNLPEVTSRS